MPPRRGALARIVTLGLAASFATAACSSSHPRVPRATASPAPSASPRAPSPSPTPTSTANPLDGLPVSGTPQVLAVKIDNTAAAHPQAGLDEAAIVYLEEVEGGLTRLCAIYTGDRLPATVGPVRSARSNDVELLAQFGHVAFAFSGANAGVLREVHAADVHVLSYGENGALMRRDGSRRAPYNVFADPRTLLANAPDAVHVHDVGLTFGAPRGGTPATTATVRYPGATVGLGWDAASSSYLVRMDGRADVLTDGRPVRAANVVLQYVQVTNSGYVDVRGVPTPYSHTVGTGQAIVLRSGTQVSATWSRPSASEGTRFTDASSNPIALVPGTTWIVLVPVGTAVTVS